MFNKNRASPSDIWARCVRAAVSNGNFFPVNFSVRFISSIKSSVPNGSNTPTWQRDNNALFRLNDGFSVVAPMKTTVPSSKYGSRVSCCVLLKRWISSINNNVPRPICWRSFAASTAFLISAVPENTADIGTKSMSTEFANARAIVVLPHPGGPHKIRFDNF